MRYFFENDMRKRARKVTRTRFLTSVTVGLLLSGLAWAVSPEQLAESERLRNATEMIRQETPIAPGIEHLHMHIQRGPRQPGPWNIHALKVDLTQPGVEVRIVEASGELETLSSICRRVGAVAAVNGGYLGEQAPCGLVVTDGRVRHSAVHSASPRAAFGLYENKAWIDLVTLRGESLVAENPTNWFDWAKVRDVLGGGPRLIFKSKVAINAEAEGFEENRQLNLDGYAPRTVLGLRKDRMFLVTIDGRQPDVSIGMKMSAAAGFLRRICGTPYAMALAGGDLTTMVIQGRVVNLPSGRDAEGRPGVEQPVANAVCLFLKGEAP